MGVWMKTDPMFSKRRMPTDETPRKMVRLLLELLRSDEPLSAAIAAGAFSGIRQSTYGRPPVARHAVELGVFDVGLTHLRTLGSPEIWMSCSRERSGISSEVVDGANQIFKCFVDEAARPDKAAYVQSGLFDDTLAGIAAVERMGTLDDVGMFFVFAYANARYVLDQPGCPEKVRALASALRFCLDNPPSWAQNTE
jgi:hypothetical protein